MVRNLHALGDLGALPDLVARYDVEELIDELKSNSVGDSNEGIAIGNNVMLVRNVMLGCKNGDTCLADNVGRHDHRPRCSYWRGGSELVGWGLAWELKTLVGI